MSSTNLERRSLLRETLILIIAGSALLILASFTFWLYSTSKKDVNQQVDSRLHEVKRISELLVDLKKKELQGLAGSLAGGPVLKGALSTGHRPTIEDVLEGVRLKNKLTFVLVIENKSILYSSRIDGAGFDGRSLKEVVAGNFLGAAVTSGNKQLLLGISPSSEVLQDWKKITGAEYQLLSPDGKNALVKTGGPEKDRPWDEWGFSNVTEKGDFYRAPLELLKGTLKLGIYLPRADFWKKFFKKRNSLFMIGGVLFFIALVLAIAFAWMFEKFLLPKHGHSNRSSYLEIVAEIDRIRDEMLKKAGQS